MKPGLQRSSPSWHADGRIKQWSAFEANTRMAQPSAAYLEKEQRFLNEFKSKFEDLAGIVNTRLN